MLNYAWGCAPDSFRRINCFSCCEVRVRSFAAADNAASKRLYREGLLASTRDRSDIADLEDVLSTYFVGSKDHFWVAECCCEVVGMVAITVDDQRIGHLRWLSVDPRRQQDRYIAALLVEGATAHARCHDCLKLLVHTQLDDEVAIALLHGLGCHFSRSRDRFGRHELEFYMNLYGSPETSPQFDEHCALVE